jgi:hypothetical protein
MLDPHTTCLSGNQARGGGDLLNAFITYLDLRTFRSW